MPKLAPTAVHGIDLNAPGGVAALFDFHRSMFGDAVMEADTNGEPGEGDSPSESTVDETVDEKLGDAGKKALNAERAARAKAETELRAAQVELQRIADSKLSDIEKANKAAAEAQARVVELETSNARLAALAKHPVPEEYQDLITGSDVASYEASAKKLSELYAKAEGKPFRMDPIPGSGTRTGGQDPAGSTVSAGRDLYAQRHQKTKS